MTKCRNLLIAAVAGATMLIGALPAQADDKVRLRTTDAHPGASASLVKGKDRKLTLTACDDQADGYGVRAYASYGAKDENLLKNVRGYDHCKSRGIVAGFGKTVYVKVCLRDHNGANRDVFCSPWEYLVA